MTDERPDHVPWSQRVRGVLPLAGGYDGYLQTLRWIAESIKESPATLDDLAVRYAERFHLKLGTARSQIQTLAKFEFLSPTTSDSRRQAGSLVLDEFVEQWLLDRDPVPLMVKLHNRVQFIGEMLEALARPRTTKELHRYACDNYEMEWQKETQIQFRRGWLQSAELVGTADSRLYRTEAGAAFLDLVVVERPVARDTDEPPPRPTPVPPPSMPSAPASTRPAVPKQRTEPPKSPSAPDPDASPEPPGSPGPVYRRASRPDRERIYRQQLPSMV